MLTTVENWRVKVPISPRDNQCAQIIEWEREGMGGISKLLFLVDPIFHYTVIIMLSIGDF